MPNMYLRNKQSSGSALVVVLWVVGLLSMFVLAFAFDMHIEARVTSTWRRKLHAEYLARAGIEYACMTIYRSAEDVETIKTHEKEAYVALGNDQDTRNEVWGLAQGQEIPILLELDNGHVEGYIQPINATIPLVPLIKMLLEDDRHPKAYPILCGVLKNVGVPWETHDALIDCLLDWVDDEGDAELVRLNGAESSYYESLDPPYKCKNRMLDTVEELKLVKGFNELIPDTDVTIYEAIAGYFNGTSATTLKINVNAADKYVLMAFLDIDEQMAEEITTKRDDDETPYKDLSDLQTRVPLFPNDMSGDVMFNAECYNIVARGIAGDVTHQINCVVEYQGKGKDLLILSWTEGEAGARPTEQTEIDSTDSEPDASF